MTKKLLMVVITALIVTYGAMGASAQQNRSAPMMQNQQQTEQGPSDQQGSMMGRPGMMDMMGRGMMGDGMMGGRMGHGGMMSPLAMRIIFILMDTDGDGTVSLQEFQAAHERIFKAMDADKDGTVSLEEFQAFMHGTGQPAQRQ